MDSFEERPQPHRESPAEIPWESPAELGPLTSFFRTAGSVLRGPDAFFRNLPPEGPTGPALGFWALTTLPPLVIAGISGSRFVTRLLSGALTNTPPVDWHIPWWVFTVAAPLLQFASLLFGVAVLHVVLRGMGVARGGWSGTWRAAGYASAPALIGWIPLIGAPVAGLWGAILQFMALRRVHRTGAGALLLAYLLPVILFAMLGLILSLLALKLFSPDLLSPDILPAGFPH